MYICITYIHVYMYIYTYMIPISYICIYIHTRFLFPISSHSYLPHHLSQHCVHTYKHDNNHNIAYMHDFSINKLLACNFSQLPSFPLICLIFSSLVFRVHFLSREYCPSCSLHCCIFSSSPLPLSVTFSCASA